MFWTDNMCIPLHGRRTRWTPMTLMDYVYEPAGRRPSIEYYNDYVCPVPAAKPMLRTDRLGSDQALTRSGPTSVGEQPARVPDAAMYAAKAHVLPRSRPRRS